MKQTQLWLAACLIAAAAGGAAAQDNSPPQKSVASLPPSVVATAPQAGDLAVDPDLNEIRVTFSKDMMTNRMWSICQTSKDTFPTTAGAIHYIDQRTCVMPVKLEPGKTYVLWFNQGQFNAFRDTKNRPSVPYLLTFETRK